MKPTAHIVKSPIGIFAFDDEGNLLMYKFFNSYREYENNAKLNIDGYELVEDETGYKFFRQKFRELALLKFSSDEEINEYLTKFGVEFSRKRMKSLAKRDAILVQAVRTYEDLQKEVNVMAEHFYEWFLVYYPEIRADPLKVVKLFHEYGSREKIPGFSGTSGIDLSDDDLAALKEYCEAVYKNIKFVDKLEKYIKRLAKEIAPNMSNVVGPLIAAKLISKAGSLKKIASISSSTIQLLGAEKALFRFLKNKKRSKPPKYGIIYFSPYIQKAPKNIHGKLARIIASKLSIAAKIDYYSGRIDENLKEDLEKEINAVMG